MADVMEGKVDLPNALTEDASPERMVGAKIVLPNTLDSPLLAKHLFLCYVGSIPPARGCTPDGARWSWKQRWVGCMWRRQSWSNTGWKDWHSGWSWAVGR